jgi:hypothetical protein
MRSSERTGVRSAMEPPKMVSIVDELAGVSDAAGREKNVLGGAEDVVHQTLRVLLVGLLGVDLALGESARQVRDGQARRAVGLGAGRVL